jgi:hypothetical protein
MRQAGFFEAVHSAADFDVGIVMIVEWDRVFINDFLGRIFAVDAHVLEVGHGGAEVVVLDVHVEIVCVFPGIGDAAVEVDFCVQHGDSGGVGISRVVELVSTHSASGTVHFVLLWLDIADEVVVGDLAVWWDLMLVDEKSCVGLFDVVGSFAVHADALEETAEFIGGATGPFVASIGALMEGGERILVAGDGVVYMGGERTVNGDLGEGRGSWWWSLCWVVQ